MLFGVKHRSKCPLLLVFWGCTGVRYFGAGLMVWFLPSWGFLLLWESLQKQSMVHCVGQVVFVRSGERMNKIGGWTAWRLLPIGSSSIVGHITAWTA